MDATLTCREIERRIQCLFANKNPPAVKRDPIPDENIKQFAYNYMMSFFQAHPESALMTPSPRFWILLEERIVNRYVFRTPDGDLEAFKVGVTAVLDAHKEQLVKSDKSQH